MKRIDLRKYIFSYIYILFSFLLIFSIWLYCSYKASIPPADPNENDFIPDGIGHFFFILYSLFSYFVSAVLLVLEFLIREVIIKKIFPNPDISVTNEINKKDNKLYVIFHVLMVIITIPLILIILLILLINWK